MNIPINWTVIQKMRLISLNQVNICFSAYSVLNLKNITNFAVADRFAEAPVWGLAERDVLRA